MDELDKSLIAILRKNGRAPIASLAASLGISRATVRAHLEKLQAGGAITGFTVRLREDDLTHPVRGITLIKIDGPKTERIIAQLHRIPAVQTIHTTNGKWDLIIQMATGSLAMLDEALDAVREIDGISGSETNLLLATRHPKSTAFS